MVPFERMIKQKLRGPLGTKLREWSDCKPWRRSLCCSYWNHWLRHCCCCTCWCGQQAWVEWPSQYFPSRFRQGLNRETVASVSEAPDCPPTRSAAAASKMLQLGCLWVHLCCCNQIDWAPLSPASTLWWQPALTACCPSSAASCPGAPDTKPKSSDFLYLTNQQAKLHNSKLGLDYRWH